jgi:integrase
VPYYKRQIPRLLRPLLGSSTFTVRLAGMPGSKAFYASYSKAHSEAERRIAEAQEQRRLSAHEVLGVAGQWAQEAGPQPSDTTYAEESAAVLEALQSLGIVLPRPIPADWGPGPLDAQEVGGVVQAMAQSIHAMEHPCLASPDLDVVFGEEPAPTVALRHLQRTVQECAKGLDDWIGKAHQQLQQLGVVVGADQVQQVALRIASTAAALGEQVAQIEAGRFPPPLQFPPPPEPRSIRKASFTAALERWKTLRSPAAKTYLDTEKRLQELAAEVNHDQLEQLTGEQISGWKTSLLQTGSTTTAKRKLGLVRAVLTTAAADGLPVPQAVLDRLSGKGLREASGTRQRRRPFTLEEASRLWMVSREQNGRALDRWALPLGLCLGARLEELAGLRKEDVREIDGIPVAVIEPSEDRRLKNDSSTRRIPIPAALVQEGFLDWVAHQGDGLLFEEPKPPAADPRRSHYASIRLAKIIREQAGVTDRTAVFHSTRHFVTQSLVDAGIEERAIQQIVGHASKSMTARYSRGGMPLAQLAEAMERRRWAWCELQSPSR